MRIVELGEYSMMIMKDSEDDIDRNPVGDICRYAARVHNLFIMVDVGDQLTFDYLETLDFIYSSGRLVLFFKEPIPSRFHLHDRVILSLNFVKNSLQQ